LAAVARSPGLQVGLGLGLELAGVGLAVLDLAGHPLDQPAVLLEPDPALLELLDRAVVLVLHLGDRVGLPEEVGQLVQLSAQSTEHLSEDHAVSPGMAVGRWPAPGPTLRRGAGGLKRPGRQWAGAAEAGRRVRVDADRRIP
jgi:hypothetical protein